MPPPYEDAPRLPEGERIDLRSLADGDWVELEIGPGRGWFLVERAQVEPRAALIGLEVRRKWASVVDARLATRGLRVRARVFAEDARIALPRLGPEGSVRRAFVHFPDPWWKKRHHKRLLMRGSFLGEIARLLEPGGELFVQTDVEERAEAYESLTSSDNRFTPDGDAPGSPRLADNPYGARSPRERRAIADGLPVHRLRWKRGVAAICAVCALVWARHAGASPRASKGPYLTSLSDTGIDVRFELAAAEPAAVEVSRDVATDPAAAPAPRVFQSPDHSVLHVVRVAGLDPATQYRYGVRVGGVVLAKGHFVTAPRQDVDAPLTFLVYGDNRTDATSHAAVVRAMLAVPSDFLVNTGDLVEDGGSAQDWQTFFDVESPLLRQRALFVAIGNHELSDDRAGANFARYFGFADSRTVAPGVSARLYGSVRLARVRLFFLNGTHDWSTGEERQWLESELARSDAEPGVVWRIAVVHHSPWSSGPHGANARLVDAHVPEVLAAHKVDLLLAGHDHIYERGDAGALKYIVSGGGGAPLYRVTSDLATTRKAEATYHFVELSVTNETVRIVAHRLDGTVLDRCGFGKGAPWDCDGPRSAADAEAKPSAAAVADVPPTHGASTHCGCDVPGASRAGWLSAIVLGAGFAAGHARRRGRVKGSRSA
jgi:tRNA (guanine-N(7)-)-methyltransferase